MGMARTLVVLACVGFAVAAEAQETQAPRGEDSPAFTLAQPACRNAWTREALVRYLRTEPVSRWGPERVLSAARRGDEEAKFARAALQDFMRESSGDGDMFRRTVNLGSEPIPLVWVDLTGDGLCDVIARWYGGTGNHDFDVFFVFRQTADGFRLELNTNMKFEISSYGERPMPVLPVLDARDGAVYLFGQQALSLGYGELNDTEFFNATEQWRHALRWNAKTRRFDELQMSGPNAEKTPTDRFLQAMWAFVKSQPPELRGACPTGALAPASCNQPE
ncbi:hypothetical protein BH09PSE6_BH09PSE6_25260 [soil metagenome]